MVRPVIGLPQHRQQDGDGNRTGAAREDSMKDLIKQYLDQGISRRQLVSGLSSLGMSTVAAKAMAQNLAPAAAGQTAAPASAAPAAIREVEGNGGRLFVEQLKAAG